MKSKLAQAALPILGWCLAAAEKTRDCIRRGFDWNFGWSAHLTKRFCCLGSLTGHPYLLVLELQGLQTVIHGACIIWSQSGSESMHAYANTPLEGVQKMF